MAPINYKGEVKSLENVPIGAPIEIVDTSVFSTTHNLKAPVYGIMSALNNDPYKDNFKYPTVKVWGGTGFTDKILFSKEYSAYNYRGLGLDPKIEAFKVLTGTKGKTLFSEYRKKMLEAGNLPFTTITFSSGADPEIFAVDENDNVIPAWLWLPKKPEKASDYGDIFWDGYQAEYTIKSSTCLAFCVDYMQSGLVQLNNALHKFNAKAKLTIKNVLPVSEESLNSAIEEHVTFGCKPSLNAYGATGLKIENPRTIPFRFAGGHIHLGNTSLHTNIEETVKMLDALVGVWGVGAFAKLDSPVRRKFYGLAGEYRKPSHGLEYRTLSNAWLCHPAIAHNVYDMARYVASLGYSNMRKMLITESEDKIQKIINNCDVKEARKMVDKYKTIYKLIAKQRYGSDISADVTLRIAANGVESVLDPNNLVENWSLNGGWVGHSEGAGKNFSKFSRLKG